MASDTPAPVAEPTQAASHRVLDDSDLRGIGITAEPTDEALVKRFWDAVRAAARFPSTATDDEQVDANSALMRRLAAKDEALAKMQEVLVAASQEHAKRYIALEAAEAALAECRAKVIEECAAVARDHAARAFEIGGALGQSLECSSGRNHGAQAVTEAIRALATKEAR